MVTIGILALQGAFAEHEAILDTLGAQVFYIRNRDDWDSHRDLDGLILPGGESTVMGKLLRDLALLQPIKEAIEAGFPVFGTCAGLILLAKDLGEQEDVHLATMDITVSRNAYGRQLGSFLTEAPFEGLGQIPMTFIRGPIIEEVGPTVTVLARVDGAIVAAREGNMLVTAFHPELTKDSRVHTYFLDTIRKRK